MREEKSSARPAVVCPFGALLFLPFSAPLASAALAGFDHHVGELLDARRAAYEVHDGEGLQVLGDAAGSGRRLRVHLVVQGQDLSEQRAQTWGVSQRAASCEETLSSPPSPVVPESTSFPPGWNLYTFTE